MDERQVANRLNLRDESPTTCWIEAVALKLHFELGSHALHQKQKRAFQEMIRGRHVIVTSDKLSNVRIIWPPPSPNEPSIRINTSSEQTHRVAQMDLFDILEVCKRTRSLSEAGRTLFSASIGGRTSTNDADRLGKYPARFEIDWAELSSNISK